MLNNQNGFAKLRVTVKAQVFFTNVTIKKGYSNKGTVYIDGIEVGEVDAPYAEFYVQPGIHTIIINIAGAGYGQTTAEQFAINAGETLGIEYVVVPDLK